MDFASGRSSFGSFGSLAASQSLASLAGAGMGAIMRTVSSVGQLWSPTRRSQASAMFRDDWALGLASGLKGGARRRSGSGAAAPPDAVGMPVPADAPAPSFLPMFPWYSGTSADLLKTSFDLIVSVKVRKESRRPGWAQRDHSCSDLASLPPAPLHVAGENENRSPSPPLSPRCRAGLPGAL